MIDWAAVGRGALWITGLAVVLSTLSYMDWWRAHRRWRWRRAWNTPRFLTPFSLGMFLFNTGLALSGRHWWEIGAWVVLAILFLAQSWVYARAGIRSGWDSGSGD